MKKIECLITSPPDRKNLVYEIWQEHSQIAEISKEPGENFQINIYMSDIKKTWHFDLDKFLKILNDAKETLKSNP